MHRGTPVRLADVGWLMLLGTASLGAAWLAHRQLGLSLQPQGWVHWMAFLLLGPWVEEWALRRQLLPECARWLNTRCPRQAPWVANGVVSLIFVALHHGMAGALAWLWFIPSWVLGMVWFRFQRLSVCALLHTWFNVSLLIVSVMGTAHASTLQPSTTPSTAPSKVSHMSDCLEGAGAGPGSAATPTSALVTARLVDAGVDRLAWVQAMPPSSQGQPGGWALVVQAKPLVAGAPARCWHNGALLGTPDTAPLPDIRFEHGLLVLTWWRQGAAEASAADPEGSFQEMHRMVFDTDRATSPLVRYEHQVSTVREVRGVHADLVQHKAQWHRTPVGAKDSRWVTGDLKPLPLMGLQDMPEHTAYSLQPQVNRVYRASTR